MLSSEALEVFTAHKSEELSQGRRGQSQQTVVGLIFPGVPSDRQGRVLSLARAHESPGKQDARAIYACGTRTQSGEHVPGWVLTALL